MKRSLFIILFFIVLFTACFSTRVADVTSLSAGMTQEQVNQVMGLPVRTLSSSYDENGRIDVYEYYTYRNEAYAIEFWNGRMARYDFMYEDVPPSGIAPRPPYDYYPDRPSRPDRPTQPNRPSQPARPSQPDRPGNGRPSNSGRPGNNERPSYGNPSTKPSENRPGNSSGRPSYSTGTSRPASNSSEQKKPKDNAPVKEQDKDKKKNEIENNPHSSLI